MGNINADDLKNVVSGALKGALEEIITGTETDLINYLSVISTDMTRAMMTGDLKLKEELLAQTQLIGELNRIRVVNSTWATVTKIVDGFVTIGLRTLIGAI